MAQFRKKSIETKEIEDQNQMSFSFVEELNYELGDNMLADEYQELASRTLNLEGDFENCVFGIIGESGEIVDKLKKIVYHKHPFDEKEKQKLSEEFGDMMWYLAAFATCYNFKLSEIYDLPCKGFTYLFRSAKLTKEQQLKYLCYQLNISVSLVSRQYGDVMVMDSCEFDAKDLMSNLGLVMKVVQTLAKHFEFDMDEIMEENIIKLKMRYKGNGFSVEESLNRV